MQINLSELNDGANPSKNLMKDMQVSVSDSISKMAASARISRSDCSAAGGLEEC